MDAQTKTLQLLEKSEIMKQVVAIEPDVLAILLSLANTPPPRDWTRWDAYSDLKRACSVYVGWQARKNELATSRHWEAFIAFIDLLLPVDERYYGQMEVEGIA